MIPGIRRRSIWSALVAVVLTTTATLAVAIGIASASGPWYASPSGSGGCTSSTDACSIATAISDADTAGGGTVYLETGTYALVSTLSVSLAGSLTIQADTGAAPLLSGGNSVQVMTIASGSNVTLTGLTIENGTATNGGGVSNSGTLTVKDSTFTGNSVTNAGGALYNNGGSSVMTVEDSTIASNSAVWVGAGLQNYHGTMTIENSTVASNSITSNASGHFGAGLNNYQATTTIESSTFAGNTTGAATGGGNAFYAQTSGTISVAGTIVTGSGSTDCANSGGSIVNKGYNIDNDGTCGFTAAGSLSNSSYVNLGSLASNGGPTQTMKPLTSSASVGAIPDPTSAPAGFPNPLCSMTDQTGTSSGSSPCTMGALFVTPLTTYHAAPTSAGTDSCADATDPCTIQNALAVARASGNSIDLATGTYTLTSTAAISLSGSLTIQAEFGASPIISGNNLVQVMSIASGSTVTLNGLKIENGKASAGGGILNAGTLTVSNSTLTSNAATAGDGGGISSSGPLTISGSTLSSNTSSDRGAAIYVSGAGASLTISSSSISGNSGVNYGAVTVYDTTTVSNSTFSGNTTTSAGGGGAAITAVAPLTISNSTFDGNGAGGGGGGALRSNNTVNVTESTFSSNTAASGSDVANLGGGTYSVSGDIFGGSCTNSGTWHDLGYNATLSGSGCTTAATGDVTDSSLPGDLGALANNGGSTQTVKPNAGGAEIGAIPDPTSGLCPAIDQTGAKSNDENCTIGALFVSSTPGGLSALTATANVASVSLSWTAPQTNGANTVTGYNIYVGTSSGGESATAVNASPVSGTSYNFADSNYSTPDYFKVKAVDASGTSIFSNEASATAKSPPPPPQPTSTSLSASSSAVNTGQGVIFTATVTSNSSTPSGTVNFYANGSQIAGCADLPLGGVGTVTCSTSFSSPGSLSISATFNGTALYSSSSSSTLSLVVSSSTSTTSTTVPGSTTTSTTTPTSSTTSTTLPTTTTTSTTSTTVPPTTTSTPTSTTTIPTTPSTVPPTTTTSTTASAPPGGGGNGGGGNNGGGNNGGGNNGGTGGTQGGLPGSSGGGNPGNGATGNNGNPGNSGNTNSPAGSPKPGGTGSQGNGSKANGTASGISSAKPGSNPNNKPAATSTRSSNGAHNPSTKAISRVLTPASKRAAASASREAALAQKALNTAKALDSAATKAASSANLKRVLANKYLKAAQNKEAVATKAAKKLAKDQSRVTSLAKQAAKAKSEVERYLGAKPLTPYDKSQANYYTKLEKKALGSVAAMSKTVTSDKFALNKAKSTVLVAMNLALSKEALSANAAVKAAKLEVNAVHDELNASADQAAADRALAASRQAKVPPDTSGAAIARADASKTTLEEKSLRLHLAAVSAQVGAALETTSSYRAQESLNKATLQAINLENKANSALASAATQQARAKATEAKYLKYASEATTAAHNAAKAVAQLKQKLMTLLPNTPAYKQNEGKLNQFEQKERNALNSAAKANNKASNLEKSSAEITLKLAKIASAENQHAESLILSATIAANKSAETASRYEAIAANEALLAQGTPKLNSSTTVTLRTGPKANQATSKSSGSKILASATIAKARTMATKGLNTSIRAVASGTGSSASKILKIPGERSAAIAIQFNFSIGSVFSGSHFAVSGNGLKPGTVAKVVLHSNPTIIAQIPVDSNGGFAQSVSIPNGVVDGSHHILVDGQGPSGTPVSDQWPLKVSSDGSVSSMPNSPTVLFPPQPPSAEQPAPGAKVIGNQVYSTYNPVSHPATVVSTMVGAFAIMSLMGAGGIGASAGGAGQDEEGDGDGGSPGGGGGSGNGSGQNGRDVSDRERGSGAAVHNGGGERQLVSSAAMHGGGHHDQGGHGTSSERHHEGASLASFEIKHSNVTHETKGRGDHSRFWDWVGASLLDEWSQKIPEQLNPWSPMIGKLSNDGVYARAMLGPGALLLPVLGLALGVAAVFSTSGQAVPPSFGIFAAMVVLSVFDGLSGLLGGCAFGIGVLLCGGIDSTDALRTLLGMCVIFFAAPVVMSKARPARRLPAKNLGEWTDRFGDLAIGGLVTAWGIEKMVGTLPALAGVSFGLTSKQSTIAIAVLLAVAVRMMFETAAVHHYPLRLKAVTPSKFPEPSLRQQHISNMIRAGLIGFVAYAYLGNVWELYAGAAIGLVVGVLIIHSGKLPNVESLTRYIPKGIVKTLILLATGTALGAVLKHWIHGGFELMAIGFIVLSLPSYLVDAAGLFARKGQKWKVNWPYRISGAVAVCVGVLLVLGTIKL